jgi:hypothetical protein
MQTVTERERHKKDKYTVCYLLYKHQVRSPVKINLKLLLHEVVTTTADNDLYINRI